MSGLEAEAVRRYNQCVKRIYQVKRAGSRKHLPVLVAGPVQDLVRAALERGQNVRVLGAEEPFSIESKDWQNDQRSDMVIALGPCDLGQLSQCGDDVFFVSNASRTVLDTLWSRSTVSRPPRCRIISVGFINAEDPLLSWEITDDCGSVNDQGQRVVTIGAVAGNDIVALLPGVSRRHGMFTFEADRAVFSDVGSASGSRVDGAKINSAPLKHGSELILGYWTFLVELDPEILARPPTEPPERAASRERLMLSKPTHLGTLYGLGELAGLTWDIQSDSSHSRDDADRATFTVGRFPSCDVVVEHPSVAKLHMMIAMGPSQARPANEASAVESDGEVRFCGAPLEVDGQDVTKTAPIKDGSVIRLGAVSLLFRDNLRDRP